MSEIPTPKISGTGTFTPPPESQRTLLVGAAFLSEPASGYEITKNNHVDVRLSRDGQPDRAIPVGFVLHTDTLEGIIEFVRNKLVFASEKLSTAFRPYDDARISHGMAEAFASDTVIPFKVVQPEIASNAAAPISAGEEQALRNVEYYRGIVQRIGELLGDECKTADDGVLHQDVLAETVLPVLRKRLGLAPLPVLAADAQFSPPEIAPKHQDNRIEMYVTVYISRPGEKPLQIMTPWIVRDVTEGLDVPGEIYAMVKAGTADIISHVGKTYLRPNIKGTMKVVD